MAARIYCIAALAALATSASAHAGLLYQSNLNGTAGGLTYQYVGGAITNPWFQSASAGVGGSGSWAVNGSTGGLANYSVQALISGTFVSTGGTVSLQFDHRFNFETGYDGGVLYASINGGNFNAVTGSSFTLNGYTHTLNGGTNNQLAGLGAFSGGSSTSAFRTSIANLGILNAGDTIAFAFVGSWDGSLNSSGEPDWVIDNLRLTDTGPTGIVVPAPPTVLLGLIGIGFTGAARWRRLRKIA